MGWGRYPSAQGRSAGPQSSDTGVRLPPFSCGGEKKNTMPAVLQRLQNGAATQIHAETPCLHLLQRTSPWPHFGHTFRSMATLWPHFGHTLATLWPHFFAPGCNKMLRIERIITESPSDQAVKQPLEYFLDLARALLWA